MTSLRRWWCGLEPDARVFAGCYLLLLPFYLLPLVVTRLLPGLDLPFHLSMVDMLSKQGRPDSPYHGFYQATPMLAPYATHYLALRILTVGHLLALTNAHKIIIAGYVDGMPLAASSLLGVCGRSRIPALLTFPLAYNLTLHYGFISWALSLPLVLLLLVQLARLLVEGPRPGRWVAVALAAALLFLTHLQNFVYGLGAGLAFILVCGSAVAGWRRRLLAAAALLPALAAFLRWQVVSGREGPSRGMTMSFVWKTLVAARRDNLADAGGLLPDLLDRLRTLPEHLLRSFADGVDVRAARTLLVLVLLYFLLGLAGRALPGRGDRPRLGAACGVAFAGALFAYLAVPHHLPAFDLMTFFPRFAPLAVLMSLPLIPAGLKHLPGQGRPALLALPALLFGVLYGRQLIRHYQLYARETADFVALLDRAEPGHRATGLVFDRQSRVMRIESTFLGLPSYYVAAHPAAGSMTPLWYCGMRHIPCRPGPALDQLPAPDPWEPNRFRPSLAVPFFDYFFVRSPPPGDLFGRQQWAMELVDQQGTWWLWRRRPGVLLSPLDRPYDD
jgi:hypothetical protein